MNKLDFLRKLDKELSVLDKEERREILSFYEERFYTGTIYENKTEEEVIAELERPEAIAKNVLSEYGVSPTHVKTKEERYTNLNVWHVVFLLAFDVLIASSLIPALFGATIGILGSTVSYVGSLGMIIGAHSVVDEFVFAFITGGYILLFLFGLVVLEASLWVTKTIVKWHLNVFKMKNRDKVIKRLSRISVDAWFKKHRLMKTVKNLALVGALVTVIYTGFWILNNYSTVEAEYGQGEVISETITEDLELDILANETWTIVTDVENLSIDVVLVSGTELVIKHSYYEDDNFEYSFDHETNTLTIENDINDLQVFWNPADLFRLINNRTDLRIEIPRDLVLGASDIDTSNGDIEVTNVDFEALNLHTTNGTVRVSNVSISGDMRLSTSNGGIYVNDVIGTVDHLLYAHSSNGPIKVQDTDFGRYDLDTSNGRIDCTNLNVALQDGVELEAQTSNGTIDFTNVYVDIIDISTSNGPISFFNTDTSFHPSSYDHQNTNGSYESNVTE